MDFDITAVQIFLDATTSRLTKVLPVATVILTGHSLAASSSIVPSPHMGSSTKAPAYKNKGVIASQARQTPLPGQSLLRDVQITYIFPLNPV